MGALPRQQCLAVASCQIKALWQPDWVVPQRAVCVQSMLCDSMLYQHSADGKRICGSMASPHQVNLWTTCCQPDSH